MSTVAKACCAYFILLAILRMTGRRTGKRTAAFEMLLIFLLGGQMTRAVLGNDNSFTNGVLGVCTVGLIHTIVSYLRYRFPAFERVLDGTPLLIFSDGRWRREAMDIVMVDEEDVHTAAREQGLDSLDPVHQAVVERNGAISILKKNDD